MPSGECDFVTLLIIPMHTLWLISRWKSQRFRSVEALNFWVFFLKSSDMAEVMWIIMMVMHCEPASGISFMQGEQHSGREGGQFIITSPLFYPRALEKWREIGGKLVKKISVKKIVEKIGERCGQGLNLSSQAHFSTPAHWKSIEYRDQNQILCSEQTKNTEPMSWFWSKIYVEVGLGVVDCPTQLTLVIPCQIPEIDFNDGHFFITMGW